MYILCGVELVTSVSSDDRTFTHILISYQNHFELLHTVPIAGEGYLVVHIYILTIIIEIMYSILICLCP
jgi:hypothetical protein